VLSPDIVLRKRTTFPLRFRFVLGSIPRYPADAAKAPPNLVFQCSAR